MSKSEILKEKIKMTKQEKVDGAIKAMRDKFAKKEITWEEFCSAFDSIERIAKRWGCEVR